MFGGANDQPWRLADADCGDVLAELPDLVCVIALTGVIDYVNDAALPVLGFPPAELVGHRVCEFLEAEDRRNCIASMASVRRGAAPPELVHHAVRADRTIARLETRLRMLPVQDGCPRVVAVSRDVSARAAIEQQTTDRARIWSEVVELLHEGVVVLDEDGTVVAANRAAGLLLQSDVAELRGSSFSRLARAASENTGEPVALVAQPRLRNRSPELTVRVRDGCAHSLRGRVVGFSVPGASRPLPRLVLLLEDDDRPATQPRLSPSGRSLLSPRELSVLRLLADGNDVRAIALQLGLSIHTVRAHVKSILRKLDVRTQLQAVVVSARSGLLDLS